MTPELQQKLLHLRQIIQECGRTLVAYSGGVDSALVALVAHQQLGEHSVACIGVSPSYPQRELRDAVKLAETMNVPYRIVNTLEYADPNYAANPANRCYFCKTELYDRLRMLAAEEGWAAILDGNHLDDLGDHVNGMKAAREKGVRSPLVEASIQKGEVRELARVLGLPAWDKPAMACLSSRVPQGTPITPALLRQIETAEDVLADLGFRQFRVRHHGDLARIEVPAEDIPRAVRFRDEIVSGVRSAGYRHVTIDLAGFRSEHRTAELRIVQLNTPSPSPAAAAL